jgi:MFS family permease
MCEVLLTDSPFTALARTTLGGAVLVAAAVAALLAVLAWVSRPHHRHRRQAAAAAVSFPASIIVLNVILGTRGVWQSTLYTLPALAMVSTGVLFLAVGIALMMLILSGYRWLAARSQPASFIYGLLLLVVFAPLIMLADTIALTEHYLAFGYGYTIWMDIAVGLMTLALPALIFELLQRRGSSTTPPRSSGRSDDRG